MAIDPRIHETARARRAKRVARVVIATLTWSLVSPAVGFAQTKAPDLTRASIEDLMNIEITAVSHKEQRAGEVAAAAYVVTQEDIRRSGMTTLPELFRLVPGVQVAEINANKWAVSMRGFNSLFSEKMLVLIDGRTVYDRLNSGVFWESLDLPLDQIERIEVVRGPGGATWGANAVNGMINIVTKSAAETQGAAASVGVGTLDGTRGAVRYGGKVGAAAYRVYSQWAGREASTLDANTAADDRWQSQTHGFRVDWTAGRDALMVEGGATLGQLRALWKAPTGPVPAVKAPWDAWSYTHEYDAVGRWTRRGNNGASLQVQSSVDYRHNEDSTDPTQMSADVEAQYHAAVRGRHDMVFGTGYRFIDEHVGGGFSLSLAPNQAQESVVNAFAQDEIAFGPRVKVTLGAKVEHDTHVGWGVQPTARVMWTLVPEQQHVWAAVSRALHTPSLIDLTGRFNYVSFTGQGGLPIVVGALGNPSLQSEEVVTTEAGYRLEIGSVASIDVTGFVGRYDNLKTAEPLAPQMEFTPAPAHLFIATQFANLLQATSSGVEFGAHVIPAAWWRIDGSYSTFHLAPHASPASHDEAAASFDGNAPRAQWQARSSFSIGRGAELDAMVFHAGAIRSLQIDGYTRADARLQVPLTRVVALSVVGQNLFDPAHAEFGGVAAIVTPTLVPRSASVNLIWKPRQP